MVPSSPQRVPEPSPPRGWGWSGSKFPGGNSENAVQRGLSITLLPRADGETEARVGSPGTPRPQAVCPSGHGPHPGRYPFLPPSVPTCTPPRPPGHPPSLARLCASQPTIGLPLFSCPRGEETESPRGGVPPPPRCGKVRTHNPREVKGGPPLTSKSGTGLSQGLGRGRDFHLRAEGPGVPLEL